MFSVLGSSSQGTGGEIGGEMILPSYAKQLLLTCQIITDLVANRDSDPRGLQSSDKKGENAMIMFV